MRAFDGVAHGVELVIAGDDLDQAGARVAEHGEIADQSRGSGASRTRPR